MLKLAVIILLGYIAFKLIKNGAYVALENLLKKKQLDKSADLIQCCQCNRYVSADYVKKYKTKNFCSDDCIKEYQNQN